MHDCIFFLLVYILILLTNDTILIEKIVFYFQQNPFIQTRVNGLNAKKMAVDEQGMNGASIVGGSAFMTFCVLVGAIIGVKLY